MSAPDLAVVSEIMPGHAREQRDDHRVAVRVGDEDRLQVRPDVVRQ